MKYLSALIAVSLCACSHSDQNKFHPIVMIAIPESQAKVVDETPQQANVSSPCPDDMVEVEGDYCPTLEIKCLYNVDINGNRQLGEASLQYSCGEYQYPTVCLSETVHMRYCIDRFEWPNKEGEKPQDWMNWYDAKKAVESAGKRLCTAREWTLAAEGPEHKPLPYGDGYHRDSNACNFDRHYEEITATSEFKELGIKGIDVFRSKKPDDTMSQALRMFLVPSGSKPNCVSDYGVYDMAGNIDEWVFNENGSKEKAPWFSGLKGGHEWHVRNASRPMTDAHGPTFGWYETGCRACLDIKQ